MNGKRRGSPIDQLADYDQVGSPGEKKKKLNENYTKNASKKIKTKTYKLGYELSSVWPPEGETQTIWQSIISVFQNNPLRPRNKKLHPFVYAIFLAFDMLKARSLFNQYTWDDQDILSEHGIAQPFPIDMIPGSIIIKHYKILYDKLNKTAVGHLLAEQNERTENNLLKLPKTQIKYNKSLIPSKYLTNFHNLLINKSNINCVLEEGDRIRLVPA